MIDRGQLIMNDRGQLILIDWGLGSLACLLFVLHVSVASVGCYLCRRRLCFQFGLFVCLFVCPLDNWKSCEWILTKFLEGVGHGPGTNEFDFGDDLDHRQDPGIRSPKSGFTGLSNYQRILIKFYGELECGLETNCLYFGDDPHHYPDPRRTILLCWRSAEVCALWVLLCVWHAALCSAVPFNDLRYMNMRFTFTYLLILVPQVPCAVCPVPTALGPIPPNPGYAPLILRLRMCSEHFTR